MSASSGILRRHGLEHGQVWRQRRPRGAVAVEDRDGGPEHRRIIQRAGVDGVRVAFADDAAEHQPAAGGAEVARGLATAEGPGVELLRRPAEAQGAGRKAHEADRAAARRLAAVSAVAKAGERRLAQRLVAQRAAETAASDRLCGVGHDRSLLTSGDAGTKWQTPTNHASVELNYQGQQGRAKARRSIAGALPGGILRAKRALVSLMVNPHRPLSRS